MAKRKKAIPDPEVKERVTRRRFTAKYKLQILQEAEACKPGELGVLLRREGIYSTYLARWRREHERGVFDSLSPKKRGRKGNPENILAEEVRKLKRENEKLQEKLRQAELIIEAQKKISQLLSLPLAQEIERS